MAFTFDENIHSDLYKEVHGSRPGAFARVQWRAMSDTEKQSEWDSLIKANDAQNLEYNSIQILAMNSAMAAGAPDEETAARWLAEAEAI
jgi:hypothetical protein